MRPDVMMARGYNNFAAVFPCPGRSERPAFQLVAELVGGTTLSLCRPKSETRGPIAF
jgi:hypothetical protein